MKAVQLLSVLPSSIAPLDNRLCAQVIIGFNSLLVFETSIYEDGGDRKVGSLENTKVMCSNPFLMNSMGMLLEVKFALFFFSNRLSVLSLSS